MYLSDMFVAARKHDLVPELFKILQELPNEWWEVRGCKNWLRVAIMQYQKNPEGFMKKLDDYASSQDWSKGKSLEERLDADV